MRGTPDGRGDAPASRCRRWRRRSSTIVGTGAIGAVGAEAPGDCVPADRGRALRTLVDDPESQVVGAERPDRADAAGRRRGGPTTIGRALETVLVRRATHAGLADRRRGHTDGADGGGRLGDVEAQGPVAIEEAVEPAGLEAAAGGDDDPLVALQAVLGSVGERRRAGGHHWPPRRRRRGRRAGRSSSMDAAHRRASSCSATRCHWLARGRRPRGRCAATSTSVLGISRWVTPRARWASSIGDGGRDRRPGGRSGARARRRGSGRRPVGHERRRRRR